MALFHGFPLRISNQNNYYVASTEKPTLASTCMDIGALVDRIAQALGPDVTPDRVESIAVSVLSYLEEPSVRTTPVPFHEGTGERVLITAFGHDQPGVLARISTAVFESGANILDVSQKILQGYFTLIMIADISNPRTSVTGLQAQLQHLAESFGVRIYVQHEDLFNAMHRP